MATGALRCGLLAPALLAPPPVAPNSMSARLSFCEATAVSLCEGEENVAGEAAEVTGAATAAGGCAGGGWSGPSIMLLKVPRDGLVRGGGRDARACCGLGDALAENTSGLVDAAAAAAPALGRDGEEVPGLAYCSVRRELCTGEECVVAKRPRRSSGEA